MRLALIHQPIRIISSVSDTHGLLTLILKPSRQFLLTTDNIVGENPEVRCKIFHANLWKYSVGFPFRKSNKLLASSVSKAIQLAKHNGLIRAQDRHLKEEPCDAMGNSFIPIPIEPLFGNLLVLLAGCGFGALILICEFCRKQDTLIHAIYEYAISNLKH